MRDARRRLERLEYAHLRRMAANAGKPYGLSADDILDEARHLMTLSAAELDAECADALAEAQARGDHEVVRILTHGWTAVRSYR